MFGMGVTELIIILVIVLLLFGTKKLRNIGSDLGGAIRGFRKSVSDDEPAAELESDEAGGKGDDDSASH